MFIDANLIVMALEQINRKIKALSQELDKLRPLSVEDEQRIMQKFRLDWNFHSNHIEGNSLNYSETRALILFGITAQGKPMKDHLEMEGHNEAIKYIEEVVKQERPMTEQFIREIHQMILKERYQSDAITPDGQPTKKWVEVGEYKSTPNHVKTATGEIFRFASPEETPAKMEELMNWYKKSLKDKKINPLFFAVEFHYRFVRIHPFDDGNGRMARILMNFILMQMHLPPAIIPTDKREDYYSALSQADAGNLEVFFNYIGERLIYSLDLMVRGAKGEDIEDPDDLDKKLDLLQRKISSKDKIKLRRSKKAKIEVFEKVISKFINELIFQTIKFHKLFFEIIVSSIDHSGLLPKLQNVEIKELTNFIDQKINSSSLTELTYIIFFETLKKESSPVDFQIFFQVKFEEFRVIILSKIGAFSKQQTKDFSFVPSVLKHLQQAQTIISVKYHEEVDSQMIKKSVSQITDVLVKNIDKIFNESTKES